MRGKKGAKMDRDARSRKMVNHEMRVKDQLGFGWAKKKRKLGHDLHLRGEKGG